MMWDDDDGRWGMHDQAGTGWFMVILMLVVVAAVAVIVIALLRGTTPLTASAGAPPVLRGPDARAILRERFARGEIDEQEFRSRMRALDDSDPSSG